MNANGKRPLVFAKKDGFEDLPVTLPCGQCIGCRLERSRQWAIRCVHEASLYDRNCYLTLTYRDEELPPGRSLKLRDFQLFMKRLRKRFGSNIRFFHCGEYGENFGRPHYHALLFNFDFEDKRLWRVQNDFPLYTSETLSEIWGHGFCSIGAVSFESAAYVARYVMKKVTGDAAAEHYTVLDPVTGEVFERAPEYVTMSRRPGIGMPWLEKFGADVFPDDFVVLRGRRMKPPKAYDRGFEVEHPVEFSKIKGARLRSAKQRSEDNSPERLRVRERVQAARLSRLKRSLD